jgi:hypothetical protein
MENLGTGRRAWAWPLLALISLLGVVPGQVEKAAFAGSPENRIIHEVKAGDNLIKICSLYREQSNHYSLSDLLKNIRLANDLQTNVLQIGQELVIPILPDEEPPLVRQQVATGAELRGMYLTGPACGLGSVWRRVDSFIDAGGNAVVFDAKDIDGGVSFRSGHPLASWGKGRSAPVISSLPEMMDRLDRRGLYVVARLALFLDGELGNKRPDLALKNEKDQPWSERGCTWIDPRQAEAVAYNLSLARELAAAGVDEIQFDYVRFPTNGWRNDWSGPPQEKEAVALARRQVITEFLQAARDTLARYDVRISADLYGIMAWGRIEDLALTGQHVPTIASLVDVICPMIYPSHFNPGFEGHRRPGDSPGYFIGEGTRRFVDLAGGLAEIRPWLQAFPYRVSRYDGLYIQKQITAARQAGGEGWCLWNPACRYQVALGVMPQLCPDPLAPTSAPRTGVVVVRGPEAAGAGAVDKPASQDLLGPGSEALYQGALVDPKEHGESQEGPGEPGRR